MAVIDKYTDDKDKDPDIELWDHVKVVSGPQAFLDMQGQVLEIIKGSPAKNFWKLKVELSDGKIELIRYSNVEFLRKGRPVPVQEKIEERTPRQNSTILQDVANRVLEPFEQQPPPRLDRSSTESSSQPSDLAQLSNLELLMLGLATLLENLGNETALTLEMKSRCNRSQTKS